MQAAGLEEQEDGEKTFNLICSGPNPAGVIGEGRQLASNATVSLVNLSAGGGKWKRLFQYFFVAKLPDEGNSWCCVADGNLCWRRGCGWLEMGPASHFPAHLELPESHMIQENLHHHASFRRDVWRHSQHWVKLQQ